jgi:hypothetical protein
VKKWYLSIRNIPVWAFFRSCAPLDMAAWVVLSLHAAYEGSIVLRKHLFARKSSEVKGSQIASESVSVSVSRLAFQKFPSMTWSIDHDMNSEVRPARGKKHVAPTRNLKPTITHTNAIHLVNTSIKERHRPKQY